MYKTDYFLQVVVMMSFRVNATIFTATANSSNVAFLQSLSPNMFIIVNSITGLLFVPLVNHIFIPCLPCVSIKARMAIGMIVNAVAILSAGSIEFSLHSGTMSEPVHTLLLFIIPTVLITLPETLTYTSALEFIYAQSPESMKGMLTGLFYFTLGIFSGGSTVLFYLYLRPSSNTWNYANYYWILLAFSVMGLVAYVIAATFYVNRRRPSTESEEVEERRLFYNNISMP
ncbi:Protein NRT1/ PTR FAMILY 3.1 [Geodia barretti]|uniref:Protein NRT1/ PTR FAMILY 3.1 n=1 Tax=Geodia barretti TaxID=519541 RepID=A0AA35TN65_GEOBA|nr:Protein NRT1/ PTR FAMILY 3.1 [Geodia barretti]